MIKEGDIFASFMPSMGYHFLYQIVGLRGDLAFEYVLIDTNYPTADNTVGNLYTMLVTSFHHMLTCEPARYIFVDFTQVTPAPASNACKCPIFELMNLGCKCGGI